MKESVVLNFKDKDFFPHQMLAKELAPTISTKPHLVVLPIKTVLLGILS